MPESRHELAQLRAQLAATEQRLERLLAEQRSEAEAAHRARAEANRVARRMRFLSDASATLATSLDYDVTLQNVARLAVPEMADWCTVDLVGDDGAVRRLAVAHSDPAMTARVHRLRERYPENRESAVGVHAVLRTGEPQLVAQVPRELIDTIAQDDEHLRLLEELDLGSLIIVPLRGRRRVRGTMTLAISGTARRFDEADLAMAQELAARAALAIDNARLVRRLEGTQQHLEQTASELEAQTEELQVTVEELEATTEDLLQANEQLDAARQEAEAARIAAEEANAAKSQFLATMSHELRTPLNAIDGYAELLQIGIHGQVTTAQHDAIVRIRRAQKRLLSLINDVLNFAKIESGQLQFDPRDVTVGELLVDIEAVMTPQVTAREQSLVLDVPDPLLSIHTDPEKTQQILLNLLANAVKFTHEGGRIVVTAVRDGGDAIFRVADNGPGIPHDRLESIVEPFVQVGAGISRDAGGVGLGLAISRDLARAMHGDLHVQSVPGAGATFTLRLPLAAPTSDVVPPSTA